MQYFFRDWELELSYCNCCAHLLLMPNSQKCSRALATEKQWPKGCEEGSDNLASLFSETLLLVSAFSGLVAVTALSMLLRPCPGFITALGY